MDAKKQLTTQKLGTGIVQDLAITIRQPYVARIFRGEKTAEFRSWPTKVRGRVWIHAGSGVDWDETYGEETRELQDHGRTRSGDVAVSRGAIVGSVEIVDCVEDTDGGWAWKLERPILMRAPVPCSGRLRFWRPSAVVPELAAAYARATAMGIQ